jgi:hypothetical protein
MNKELLLEYAEIKSRIKELNTRLEEIKPIIVTGMEDKSLDELTVEDVGKFFFKERRTWIYPIELESAEKQLKADKKVAQQKGTATCDITRELNFRGINENNNIEE